MRPFLVAILLLSPLLAYGQISYNPLQKKEGDSATAVDAQPSLIGKTSDTGLLSFLKVDENGGLVTTALTGFGADFSFGDVLSATTTIKPVRRTLYTEQSVNAQRSFSSSSILDAAAGTGARTLIVTYYTDTGTGPFTETITLNGMVCVATTNTNIAYIEEINVLTAGVTGSNAGIISMFVNSICASGVIGTVAALNNQTFWAHHYVPAGKIANITGISAGSTSTVVGCGALLVLTEKKFLVPNSIERQVSDFVRLYGQSSTFSRSYVSPIKIAGPSRLLLHVTPECSSSITYRAAIDFFEP